MFGIVDVIETTKLPSLSKADASKGRTCRKIHIKTSDLLTFPARRFCTWCSSSGCFAKTCFAHFCCFAKPTWRKTQSNQIHPPKNKAEAAENPTRKNRSEKTAGMKTVPRIDSEMPDVGSQPPFQKWPVAFG